MGSDNGVRCSTDHHDNSDAYKCAETQYWMGNSWCCHSWRNFLSGYLKCLCISFRAYAMPVDVFGSIKCWSQCYGFDFWYICLVLRSWRADRKWRAHINAQSCRPQSIAWFLTLMMMVTIWTTTKSLDSKAPDPTFSFNLCNFHSKQWRNLEKSWWTPRRLLETKTCISKRQPRGWPRQGRYANPHDGRHERRWRGF